METLSAAENPIIIEDREELIFMLCEAAELEHMIMLQYLLRHSASSGMKTRDSPLSSSQHANDGTARFRMSQRRRCCTLPYAATSSPRSAPRRTFAVPTSHSAPVTFLLVSSLICCHLVRSPCGTLSTSSVRRGCRRKMPLDSSRTSPTPTPTGHEIVPFLQDFATVGHLYCGIKQGFRHLAEKYGEDRGFIGPPRAQATEAYFRWPELVAVTDLRSAVAAIETIVEQGEGVRGHIDEGHYGQFLRLLAEHQEFIRNDPTFDPARPVLMAWCRVPGTPDVAAPILVTDPMTADVADLFNASYEVLVQMLARFFAHTEDDDDELDTLSDTAVSSMFMIIRPLASILTRLPIGPNLPGKTAGPSFEYYRSGYLLPHKEAAWTVMYERLQELEAACAEIGARPGAPAGLDTVRANFHRLARKLGQFR